MGRSSPHTHRGGCGRDILVNPTDPFILWDLPPEEHRAFIAAGCGTETMEQYGNLLRREEAYAKSQGREVVLLRLTVKEVLDELIRIDMPCTPAGIALALRSLFENRVKNGLYARRQS